MHRFASLISSLATVFALLSIVSCGPGPETGPNINANAGNSVTAGSASPESPLTGFPGLLIASKTTPIRVIPEYNTIDGLQAARRAAWATGCGPGADWEVCFEGDYIPGWGQAAHLDWDNPIDDDWQSLAARRSSWVINLKEGSTTYMRVNRLLAGHDTKTGHFWRRDEFLTVDKGVEAEFRIRILPRSQANGVAFHFYDNADQFMVTFSPTAISFYDKVSTSAKPIATTAFNLSTWVIVKVIKDAVTGRVHVTANGRAMFGTVVTTASANTIYEAARTGSYGRIAPRIGFGDPATAVKGAYEIDYLRYRRKVRTRREPGYLAAAESCATNYPWCSLRNVAADTPFYDTKLGERMVDSVGNAFGRTIEFKAKLLANPGTAGYSAEYGDKLGGVILTIYKDRLAMKPNIRPGPPSEVAPQGFNGFAENTYRLVRPARGLYWYLYLNDEKIPVLFDIKASGASIRVRETTDYVPVEFLAFGPYFTPSFEEFNLSADVKARSPTGGQGSVSMIRWLNQPIAANGCN